MIENKSKARNELVLVDKEDNPVGKASKKEAHESPMLHRAFSVFLYNGKKMLIQQRAFHKYHSGGLWANTCCSHPSDTMEIAEDAKERLFEETGIDCPVEEIFSFVYEHKFMENLYEHEYDHVMIGQFSGDFELNPQEVAAMKWIDFDTLTKEMVQTPKKFAPWFLIAAPKVMAHITACR